MPTPSALSRRDWLQTAGLCSTGWLASGLCDLLAADPPPRPPVLIDTHTHFYDPTRPQGVPWPGKGDELLYRTVLPAEFRKLTAPHGVTGTIVVEASPWVEDNQWLLDLAQEDPFVVGIVGNLAPGEDGFAEHLQRFARQPLFRGIRVNHDRVKQGLAGGTFVADIRRLADAGLTLDVNGGPDMPADVARLAERVPELRIAINHVGNVRIDGREPPASWLAGMRAAAEHPRVFCKVSALVEGARVENPAPGQLAAPESVDHYRPVLDAVRTCFGIDRLVYGSNWPVSVRYAPYAQVQSIVEQYFGELGAEALAKFFGGNSQAAYQWQPRERP